MATVQTKNQRLLIKMNLPTKVTKPEKHFLNVDERIIDNWRSSTPNATLFNQAISKLTKSTLTQNLQIKSQKTGKFGEK